MKNIKLVFLITLICIKSVCAEESANNSRSSLMYFFSLDEETREKLSQSFSGILNSKSKNYSDHKIILTDNSNSTNSTTTAPINNEFKYSENIISTPSNNSFFTSKADLIKSVNNSVGIKVQGKYVDYMEVDTRNNNLDSETGWIGGITIQASMMKDIFFGNDYLHAEYTHIDDKTKYTGSYWGGHYGDLITNNGAKINDYSFRYGKGFEIDDDALLTPYIEVGKHSWDRILPPGSNPVMERYYFHYYGIGALAQGAITDRLVITANGMFGRTVKPKIFVNTPGDSDTLNQGASNIYKVGLDADYALTKNIHANLGIDYLHFKYGISNVSSSGVYLEPDSRTSYTTVNLGLSYHY